MKPLGKWLGENWFRIGLLILGGILGFALWQNMVVIPRERESQKEIAEYLNKRALEDCLENADTIYANFWSAQCEAEGKDADCTTLYSSHAEAAEKLKQQEKDNCFQQY